MLRNAILFGALAALLAGCGPAPVEVVDIRAAMNTVVTVRAVAPDGDTAQSALEAAWEEMAFLEKRLSRYGGEVYTDPVTGEEETRVYGVALINAEAGLGHARVDPAVTSCLGAAREVWDMTGGAFDPTVAPLLALWRGAEERSEPPGDEAIAEKVALVGFDQVDILAFVADKPASEMPVVPPGYGPPTPDEVRQEMHLVALPEREMALDLGGIAKGFIIGRMARKMHRAGATAGLVDAGGDVYAFGRRPASLAPDGADRRWGIGVQDPRTPGERDRLYTALRLEDRAAVTSGHYERGYTIGGRRYSHIIDPRTGRPVNPVLASVTVVAYDPAVADALATGLAVLGVEKALALVEETEGVECLLLVASEHETQEGVPALEAHRSSGFAALEYDPTPTAP